jgi:acyl transferase domain-containing protein
VIVEEASPAGPSGASRPLQLLVLSAATPTALDTMTTNLSRELARDPTANLADVAYTLQVGRKALAHRRMLVCRDPADAAAALDRLAPTRVRTLWAAPRIRPIVFMFPGGGSQYPSMGVNLYATEPVFRERLERGLAELGTRVKVDLRRLLRADGNHGVLTDAELRSPSVQLPALFLIEEALARLWMSWGVHPSAMIGHSMGEITAACLAGVFSFSDALGLVAFRGQLLETASDGEMLSVSLSVEHTAPLLTDVLDLASVNAPGACVASGPAKAIDVLSRRLTERGIQTARIPIATAAHSRLLASILGRFESYVRALPRATPSIPFISNVTGTWITDQQAQDPSYWAAQLGSTVRFSDGVREFLKHPDRLFLEVGPGQTLSAFVRLHADSGAAGQVVVPSLPHPQRPSSETASVLNALGRLWLAGKVIDWAGFAAHERRHRVPLPTYPFEGQRYWIDEDDASDRHAREHPSAGASRAVRPGPASIPPRTPIEREVAAIWQDVLGIPCVSIHDDFFELGGNSMLVTQAINRIEEACHVELSLLTLFESPTVADLAQCVEAIQRSG